MRTSDMLAKTNGVRMAVDIGGTFTDIVLDSGAERLTRKVLTTAKRPEQGVLDGDAVAARVAQLKDSSTEAVATCFMHSYVNPAHEQRTAAILKGAMPGLSITLSSEVCSEIREYERTSTAVANAYVQPLMDGYLARMGEALRVEQFRGAIYLVTSGGGLTSLDTARTFPVRLVGCGAAGGAIFAAQVAARGGEKKVL